MTSTYPLKNLPGSIGWLRPILLISVALHGLLLLVPTGEDKTNASLQVKDEEIKVTQLPAAPRTPLAVTTTTPGSTSLPTKPPKIGSLSTVLPSVKSNTSSTTVSNTPKTDHQAKTGSTTATASNTQAQGQATTTVVSTTPATSTAGSTTAKNPDSSKSATAQPSLATSSTPVPTSSTPSTTSPRFATGVSARNPNPLIVAEFNQTLKQLRSDFPNYPGARLGCAGLPSCYIVKADLVTIADFLKQGLESKGFDVTADSDESNSDASNGNEPIRQVYRISREGKDHTLTILSDGLYTVYALSDSPLSFEEVQKAQQHFADYTGILDRLTAISTQPGEQLGVLAATPDDFAKPELFYKSIITSEKSVTAAGGNPEPLTELNTSTDNNVRLVKSQTPNQILAVIEPELVTAGFEVKATKGQYGGGSLHQITKDNIRIFLNLVPTKDGQGTILVTWFGSPTKGMAFRNQHYFVISDRL